MQAWTQARHMPRYGHEAVGKLHSSDCRINSQSMATAHSSPLRSWNFTLIYLLFCQLCLASHSQPLSQAARLVDDATRVPARQSQHWTRLHNHSGCIGLKVLTTQHTCAPTDIITHPHQLVGFARRHFTRLLQLFQHIEFSYFVSRLTFTDVLTQISSLIVHFALSILSILIHVTSVLETVSQVLLLVNPVLHD